MFVVTVLELTDVTSTLCSVTQVLPHSQMLFFVVFHTYVHTRTHAMLPSNCPLNYSGTVRSGDSHVRTIFTVSVGLSCIMVDECRSMRVHCLHLNADSAHQDCINLLVSGIKGCSVFYFCLVCWLIRTS